MLIWGELALSKKAKKHGKSTFGQARSKNDFQRRQGQKPPGKVVIIVCEGKETEPNYFEALRQKFRLSTLNVRLVPGKGAPINVVDYGIEEKRKIEEPTDEIWCVLDTEAPDKNSSLLPAIEKAKKANLNLAISNPSFEYWYFIHFECSNRPFANGQEMKRKIKSYIPDYNESMNVFPVLDSLTPEAIKNADKLRKRSQESWDVFPNPSTGVDKLVQEIIEMGQTKRY
ncbi:MAG: RloB domain-containing protein [Anaerolineaceae bacterium]|nr:MAG: RloB domain-containing protein [Anaerolineaceae bacterium]